MPVTAQALGLGEIETRSALNQPLNAAIELLSVRSGETDGMIVTLASQEAFLRAGIDRPFYLTQLRFTVELKPDGTPYIQVSSNSPIVEPFLNFLVEVDWPRGRLLREYTVLLDPPVFMSQQTEMADAQPALSDDAASRPGAGTPGLIRRADEPAQTASSASVPPARPSAGATSVASAPTAATSGGMREYGPVQANQTLWNIADEVKPQNVTHQQMMMALLRENPEAFYDNNINRLKRGWVLRVPDAGSAGSISHETAVAMVRDQNALWNAYRQRVQTAAAGGAAGTPAPGGAPSGSARPSAADSRLAIVTPDNASGSSAVGSSDGSDGEAAAALQQELLLTREELSTERLANEELSARIGSLEEIVAKMERLITIRESQLAELQAKMAEIQSATPPAAQVTPPVSGPEPSTTAEAEPGPAETAAATPSDGMPLAPADTPPQPQEGSAEPATADATQAEPEPEPVAESAAEVARPADAGATTPAGAGSETTAAAPAETQTAAAPAQTTQPAKLPRVVERPAESGGGFDLGRLLQDPMVMGGAGGAVILMLLGLLWMRRKKASEDEPLLATAQQQPFEVDQDFAAELKQADTHPSAQTLEDTVVALAGETLDERDNESVFADDDTLLDQDQGRDLVETMVAEPGFDEDESDKDEIIAEADVYLAYSLYSQAEELLKGAIAEKPDRLDYQEKLLETHYAARDRRAFEQGAVAFHNALAGRQHRLWDRVVAMGGDLCPDNELFKGASETGIHVEDLQPSKPETADFDLDSDSHLDADVDFGLDEPGSDDELQFSMEDEPDTMDLPNLGGTGEMDSVLAEGEELAQTLPSEEKSQAGKATKSSADETVQFDTDEFLEGKAETTGEYSAAEFMDEDVSDLAYDADEPDLESVLPGEEDDDGVEFDLSDLDEFGEPEARKPEAGARTTVEPGLQAAESSNVVDIDFSTPDDEDVESLLDNDGLDDLLESDDNLDEEMVTAEFKMVDSDEELSRYASGRHASEEESEATPKAEAGARTRPIESEADEDFDFGADDEDPYAYGGTEQLPMVEQKVDELDLDADAQDEQALEGLDEFDGRTQAYQVTPGDSQQMPAIDFDDEEPVSEARLVSEEVPVISDNDLDEWDDRGNDEVWDVGESEDDQDRHGLLKAADDEEPILVSQEMPLVTDDMLDDEFARSDSGTSSGRSFSGQVPIITDDMLDFAEDEPESRSQDQGRNDRLMSDEPELLSMEMPSITDSMLEAEAGYEVTQDEQDGDEFNLQSMETPAVSDSMLEDSQFSGQQAFEEGSEDDGRLQSLEMPIITDDMLERTVEDQPGAQDEDVISPFEQTVALDRSDDDRDDLQRTIAQMNDYDDDFGEDSAALSDEGDEVDTLLDLARAYIEMGDSESAGSALKEIIDTGNDRQKAEAGQLLQQIGA